SSRGTARPARDWPARAQPTRSARRQPTGAARRRSLGHQADYCTSKGLHGKRLVRWRAHEGLTGIQIRPRGRVAKTVEEGLEIGVRAEVPQIDERLPRDVAFDIRRTQVDGDRAAKETVEDLFGHVASKSRVLQAQRKAVLRQRFELFSYWSAIG